MNEPRGDCAIKISKLVKQFGEAYRRQDYVKATDFLEAVWKVLPDPKEEYSDGSMMGSSFCIAHSLSNAYLLAGDLSKARAWSEILFRCNLNRRDSGEREMMAGKVAFAARDVEVAVEYFAIASKKSNGRLFLSDDPKYLELLLRKN